MASSSSNRDSEREEGGGGGGRFIMRGKGSGKERKEWKEGREGEGEKRREGGRIGGRGSWRVNTKQSYTYYTAFYIRSLHENKLKKKITKKHS